MITAMTSGTQAVTYVIDDDKAVRESLRWLIESVGLPVETYHSAREFLMSFKDTRPGCIVLDVRMPEMSGLELQEHLAARDVKLPIIVITGHGDVPMVVRALKGGAIDFIEKPFNDQALLDRIQHALQDNIEDRAKWAALDHARKGLAQLTKREHEVLERVIKGESSKRVAAELGLSTKTVEAHRAKIMQKLRVKSVAELVRVAVACEDHS